jgi:hypothetical protein
MNLYDILLARCICSNKSEESIVATPLEVTENGTYEAEEGYAYNPVTVNVSSDFSTAQVTLVDNTTLGGVVLVPWVDDEEDYHAAVPMTPLTSGTITCILYKGTAELDMLDQPPATYTFTVSGEAEVEGGGAYVAIHGDCTITISEE